MSRERLHYLVVGNIGEKPVIGILGGIGSGKSTVAAEFAKLGCKVIDTDKIAHELLDKPTVKEKIVGLFGRAILDSKGKIDREKLAEVVFADAECRQAVQPVSAEDEAIVGKLSPAALGPEQNPPLAGLNEIIHPLVLQRAEELIEQYNRQNQVKAIVLDMPLLVEVGWDRRCDKLIFVDCEQKLRLDRAKKMGFDKNQVKIRENFQISLDNKVEVADNIIENNSDFSALARQVVDIFSYIVYNG